MTVMCRYRWWIWILMIQMNEGDENAQIKSNLGVKYRQVGSRLAVRHCCFSVELTRPPATQRREHWETSTPPQETQSSAPITPASTAFGPFGKPSAGNEKTFKTPTISNASFLFYNEKAEAVQVYVRDSLNTKTLSYVFQDVNIPWLKARPIPRKTLKSKKPRATTASIFPFHGVRPAIAEPVPRRSEEAEEIEGQEGERRRYWWLMGLNMIRLTRL
uniref:Polyphenol oxidase central domain-containing protein n=1 Tax=Cucumis sativus TaxID=3659 RepID=A0A0A0LUI6_CUCSA